MIMSKTASIQTKVKRAKFNELALLAKKILQFRHLSLKTQKVIASGRKLNREPVMRGEVITDDYVKFLSKKLHEQNKDRELGAVLTYSSDDMNETRIWDNNADSKRTWHGFFPVCRFLIEYLGIFFSFISQMNH